MSDPQFLLDANICIDILHGRSDLAAQRFEDHDLGQLVTSAVVYAEVMIGAERLNRATQARDFFTQIPVLAFDQAAAEVYARLPFKRGSYDRLIAAQALALNLIVVTSNTKHFHDVPGLKVEDWT